jgi:hypothetical protein
VRTEDITANPPNLTVAEALGIDPAACHDLLPFVVGTEPVTPRRAASRGPYLRSTAVDARLAEFEGDARAGVPDTLIAGRAKLSPAVVRQWRRRHGIAGHSGRPPGRLQLSFGVAALFGDGPPAVEHLTRSPVGGTWEVPEYVLREPLDYNAFVDAVQSLVRLGMDAAKIASGVGVCRRDVDHAVVLAKRSRR